MWVSLAAGLKLMLNINHVKSASGEHVEAMFNSISKHYDRLNHLLSLGIDRRWRKRAIKIIGNHINAQMILDVAAGTGDLSLAAIKLNPEKITGIDISERMLDTGKEKITRLGLEEKIELVRCNAENIIFPDETFDAVMSAFGVRNFENTLKGLCEMHRVLKHGGMVMILEFSKPSWFPMKQAYGFYFRKILPVIGRRVSGDPSAYTYLPESVMAFPDNDSFLQLLAEAGFSNVAQKKMTGGIASIYSGFRL